MLLSTLIIGIIIGGLLMGTLNSRKARYAFETPSKDKFNQRIERLVRPDENQKKQMEPIIDNFSEKAYTLEKEHMDKMYSTLDSLYIALKPLLNDTQKQNFEKRLSHIKAKTIIN